MPYSSKHTTNESEHNFVLSSNPNKAMQEMMDTIDSVRRVYVEETDALKNSDINGFLSHQDKMIASARNYQAGISQMIKRREEMRQADPTLMQRLKNMQVELAELGKQKMEALGRMQRSTERLGNVIRNAAKDAAAQERAVSYGETGHIQGTDKKAVSMGISETA